MQAKAELFRALGDEDRLRVLALCAQEELSVGELAGLMRHSQPQITKKSQPLRDLALLIARRDGARTMLSTAHNDDPVVQAAVYEGRTLVQKDGSLLRVAGVVASRDERARHLFDATDAVAPTAMFADDVIPLLPLVSALLPGRALAVDVGTGDGTILPLLSPLYERVVALDRSASRLAQCSARIAQLGCNNVRMLQGDVDDAAVQQEVTRLGGADLVVMARVLHHAARPQQVVADAARLLKRGGHLAVLEYLPHDDESMREQGDVWLGIAPEKLAEWFAGARLHALPTPSGMMPALFAARTAGLQLHLAIARRALEA